MSKGGLDITYNSGLGAVKIDPNKVANVVSHENVLQAVKRDPLAWANVERSKEVLAKGTIPMDAITKLNSNEMRKVEKTNRKKH